MNTNSQYICELYFDKNRNNWQHLIRMSITNLGFLPNVMTIYLNDRMFEDIPYNEEFLLSILSEEDIPGITIRNHIYDETVEDIWFKLVDTKWEFVSIKWSNTNLDFLLSGNLANILKIDGFVAGYVFENNDIWEQSAKAKENKESNYTVFPGQYKYVSGMKFMAAPLMWFGKSFFEIISKDKLLSFDMAYIDELKYSNLVKVKLFDIYDSPDKPENRLKQKEFWSFFDLDKVISKYEEDNQVDAEKSFKDFLTKHRKK
jgi:hypothetical protein